MRFNLCKLELNYGLIWFYYGILIYTKIKNFRSCKECTR